MKRVNYCLKMKNRNKNYKNKWIYFKNNNMIFNNYNNK